MGWLKPHALIAPRFLFQPSKVSANFTVCCLSMAMAFNLISSWMCSGASAASSLCCSWGVAAGGAAAAQAAAPARKEGQKGGVCLGVEALKCSMGSKVDTETTWFNFNLIR